MTLVFGIALYFIIWWVALFIVLPIGARSQADSGEIVPGTPASAPENPRILRTIFWTTILAGVVFAAVFAVLETPELRTMAARLFGI